MCDGGQLFPDWNPLTLVVVLPKSYFPRADQFLLRNKNSFLESGMSDSQPRAQQRATESPIRGPSPWSCFQPALSTQGADRGSMGTLTATGDLRATTAIFGVSRLHIFNFVSNPAL